MYKSQYADLVSFSEQGGDWVLQLVPTTRQVWYFSIETPRQRHVCYLHLPQASASASQRHNLMLKQVPACFLSPPLHPLTQPCLVVLTALLSDHKESRKKWLLDLLWWLSLPWLSHERITFILEGVLDCFQHSGALLKNLKSSSQLKLWRTKWVAQIILFASSSQSVLYISISNSSSVLALCALWPGGDSFVFIRGLFQRRYSIPPQYHHRRCCTEMSNFHSSDHCKMKALEQQWISETKVKTWSL